MPQSRADDWAKAKRLCRLSEDELRMARALGLSPRKLVKNRPGPSEPWKAPVGEWVRELHRRRHRDPPLQRPRPFSPAPPPEGPDEDEFDGTADAGFPADPHFVAEEEVVEEDRLLLQRQEEFRAAADFVAAAFARLPAVERVVLFGSVAQPLYKEVPRFSKFRRQGIALWHECKDVDLAVWVSDVSDLRALQKARSRALNDLTNETGKGVAHHQVDAFLLEPGSDRYRGRLCRFGTCPKGKAECRVPGCGTALFLRQHEKFAFDPGSLDPGRSVLLFDRARSFGPPPLDRWRDDIPF